MARKEWYFIRRLTQEQAKGSRETLEIQVLDSSGRGRFVGRLSDVAETLELGGRAVPAAVLNAAKLLAEGEGRYVGPHGQEVPAF